MEEERLSYSDMELTDDELCEFDDYESIVSNKLRFAIIRAKKIKINSICPYYAYYEPCPNMILNDYC